MTTRHLPAEQFQILKVDRRNAGRQRLAGRLYACGPRPVFEAMLEVESGRPLDDVLARFTRIPPSIYHALGADELSIDYVAVIDGGRS
jgi:hypothetical protein